MSLGDRYQHKDQSRIVLLAILRHPHSIETYLYILIKAHIFN